MFLRLILALCCSLFITSANADVTIDLSENEIDKLPNELTIKSIALGRSGYIFGVGDFCKNRNGKLMVMSSATLIFERQKEAADVKLVRVSWDKFDAELIVKKRHLGDEEFLKDLSNFMAIASGFECENEPTIAINKFMGWQKFSDIIR